ncbi:MAG: hypothetical protein MUD14_20830 [Hydrococcus sp. Prado102]|jgi:hypothetical protein|nr:hypothetical protein [Hydrococcus sp. Prado102]
MSIRILLQTTLLPTEEDDWTIARFSMLRDYLASIKDELGNFLFQVTARDREPDSQGNDPILSHLDSQTFDELWLFALDVGGGLSDRDLAGIIRFHQQGGGILTTRDHQDMGISMCGLENIGVFHYFNKQQKDPDESRCCIDDCYTTYISWPNYHSGRNGDYQVIQPIEPIHELLKNPESPIGTIQYFPAHPHEGGIGVPPDAKYARVIATGKSLVTERPFNLAIAVERVSDERENQLGRVVAQSTFHHFVDYNWDISKGCPSFVDEPPGEGMQKEPQAVADIQCYVKNLALWLAPTS